jgi:hypothetical protein
VFADTLADCLVVILDAEPGALVVLEDGEPVCTVCHGVGVTVYEPVELGDPIDEVGECPECLGTGAH